MNKLPDIDVINHLLEQEELAAGMLRESRSEADRRIAKARADAEADFKAKYEKVVGALDADYTEQTAKIESEHSAQSAEYHGRLEALKTDKKAFNALCNTYFDIS
jgi:vacuolar-type H+-ATPase subunit H